MLLSFFSTLVGEWSRVEWNETNDRLSFVVVEEGGAASWEDEDDMD